MARAEIVERKELFITDPSVVNDARTQSGGPWSMGSLLTRLAGSPQAADALTLQWLSTWEQTSMNGMSLIPRPIQRIQKRWGRDATGALLAKFAPFRLLGVIYRPDAQEGRLIYCAIDPITQAELQFNVILEFQLPGSAGPWARAFHELGSLPFGSEYNASLATLIAGFVAPKNLLRLLTNEVELGLTWEMREFQLNPAGGLELVPLAFTPHDDFAWSRSGELAAWLGANSAQFLRGVAELPESLSGGSGSVFRDNFFWLQGSGVEETARKAFGMKTCSGCHGAESSTLFTHVTPRNRRAESVLSAFVLTQLPVRARALQTLLDAPLASDHAVPPPPPLPLSKRRAHN